MTATDVLHTLLARNIQLTVDGEYLRYEAPEGAMTPEVLALMREHKPALLALLTPPSPPPQAAAEPNPQPLSVALRPPPYPGRPVGTPFRPGHQVWLYRFDDHTPRFMSPVVIAALRLLPTGEWDIGFLTSTGELTWHNANLAVRVASADRPPPTA
jgi:TubC N-terminal docking domain